MGVNSTAVERTSAKGVDFRRFVSIIGTSNERQGTNPLAGGARALGCALRRERR